MLRIRIRNIFLIVLLLIFNNIFAAEEAAVKLEQVTVDLHDKVALLKGAKFFASNCMACHTMRYLEHSKIAEEAGITLDKMPLKNKKWWLNTVPPDLTLMANVKGADWLYTYFHSFYEDKSRPTGYNNLLVKDVNMMNVFAPYQGVQVLVKRYISPIDFITNQNPHYYSVLELIRSGSMTPEQFDETTKDLVTFLVYASEPHALERMKIGYWVAGFLILMAILTSLLKWVYWKKIKK